MICETCICSPASAVDYSQTSFSGMSQLSLLSGMPTPAESCDNEPQTDGSQACTCGKEMSECLIHPSTPEKWIAYMQDSLAKMSLSPEIKRGLEMRRDPDFIGKSCVLLALFDPNTCSLKTCQQSLVMDSEPFSQTLPRWGSMRNGVVSEHPMSALFMSATGGSFLPTLTVHGNYNRKGASKTSGDGLVTALKKLPTLCARDWKDTGTSNAERNRNTPPLAVHAGGPLNPEWCEWYMGFPLGFTELKDSETPKSRYKQQSHTDYLEGSEAA